MGRIIRLGTDEGPTHPFLTKTGRGGVLSPGYLQDQPACEYVEADETPLFVLTNSDRGVQLGTAKNAEVVEPGPGYRAIAVVTDRRLVAIVGDTGEYSTDGDRSFSVSLGDVESVEVGGTLRDARLEIQRDEERPLVLYTGSDGLDNVREYLESASSAWNQIEAKLDAVEETLEQADAHRETGEYERTLAVARDAYDLIKDAKSVADTVREDWPGSAMTDRIEAVESDCVRTVAEIRADRARAFTELGERHWRADEYERAHDAFDNARVEYETLLSLDDEFVGDPERIRSDAARLERFREKLQESPLREAVEADKRAAAADSAETAAGAWTDAFEAYRTAIDLDFGADERRFAGDPEDIRSRLNTVVDHLVTARRKAAKEAREAGDWHVGADRIRKALAEFETARSHYQKALRVAQDCYPDASDHLRVELDALENRIERVSGVAEPDRSTAQRSQTNGNGTRDVGDPDRASKPTPETDSSRVEISD